MIILGVPITDTFLAIIRRTLSGQKFYKPDRNHLHHRLLSLGLTHRGTVLVIYGISMIFSLISLLLNISSRIGGRPTCDRALVWSRVVSRIDWDSGATS